MKPENSIYRILWVALLLAPVIAFAQERRVDWIHGLGGDADSWQNVNDTYVNQGRQIVQNSRWPYNTGNGIQAFANEITGRNLGGANTISISHSMGGTAVRAVDLVTSDYWAGNITAGSPLSGGQIAVSAQNGVALEFIQRSTVELLRGPAVGSMVFNVVPNLIGVALPLLGSLGIKHSNTIADALVNAITDKYNLTVQTANDLNPTGAYMQNIANQGSDSPKINVWGNEDNPVLWRVAGSYAGGSDQSGVDFVNTAAGIYDYAANAEYAFRYMWYGAFYGFYTWRGDQWKAGADWLRETANGQWLSVIGAGITQLQWVQVLEYSQLCYDEMQWCADPQNAGQCDDSQCMQWIWVQMPVFVAFDQSDGVVPARSARNDGGAWRGHIVEAPGVNHKELLQYNTVSPTLTGIFTGNTGGNNIFLIGN